MLYLAVPSTYARTSFRERMHRGTRRVAYKALDLSRLSLRGGVSLAHLHYRSSRDRNAGDELIREAIKNQIRNAFTPGKVRFGEIEWGRLDQRVVEYINNNFDLFVIAGSGYLFLDEFGDLPARILMDAPRLREISLTKCAYGIGCNQVMELPSHDIHTFPGLTPFTHDLISSVCGGLAVISVRDGLTAELIRRTTGISAAVTGDPVLTDEEGGPPQRRQSRNSSSRIRIGLNFAVHDRACLPGFIAHFDEICRLLKALRDEYSAEFCYICHLASDAIVPLYFRRRGLRIGIRRAGMNDLPAAYCDLDLHICQMMHSSILSLRAGVPTVNLGYDLKNAAFFELLGLSEYCLQMQNLTAPVVLRAVRKLLTDEQAIMDQASAAIKNLRDSRDTFFRKLLRTMRVDPQAMTGLRS